VDYGLAYRYSPEGVPKEYKEDPKRCHDGTIEFTSIDAHKGVGKKLQQSGLFSLFKFRLGEYDLKTRIVYSYLVIYIVE